MFNYKYYLQKFNDYNPYYMNALQEAETKGEIKSIKDSFIKEYPKEITKEITSYIRKL